MNKPIDCKPTVINGDTRLLLIAPHGFHQEKPEVKTNDDYTGHITEIVANNLGCSAIINFNVHRDIINFNHYSVENECPEFIEAIKRVVDTYGKSIVVWIHGIQDTNLKEDIETNPEFSNDNESVPTEVHALIGYGQGDPSRYTAKREIVKKLMAIFAENGMNILPAMAKPDGYCGWAKTIMNQWFRNNKYQILDVESVQIEIKKTGFREKENYKRTAEIFSKVLGEFSGLGKPNTFPVLEKSHTPDTQTEAEQNKKK